jgi:hypothetical protein
VLNTLADCRLLLVISSALCDRPTLSIDSAKVQLGARIQVP